MKITKSVSINAPADVIRADIERMLNNLYQHSYNENGVYYPAYHFKKDLSSYKAMKIFLNGSTVIIEYAPTFEWYSKFYALTKMFENVCSMVDTIKEHFEEK